jgi:hypothetical protein
MQFVGHEEDFPETTTEKEIFHSFTNALSLTIQLKGNYKCILGPETQWQKAIKNRAHAMFTNQLKRQP